MQIKPREIATPKTKNASVASAPNTLYASKILGKDIEIDNTYCAEISYAGSLSEMWNHQHPLICTWLILSSVSICFLSALLFIIH